jgi:fermentation-respiration switch protein FrsA (DUF1100 family)
MAQAAPKGVATYPNIESEFLKTDEGDVETWFIRGNGATVGNPQPAIIFFHGNGETIDYIPDSLTPYRAMGFSVLLVEYRGYGRSAGKPSQAKLTADAVNAYALLTAKPEVDAAKIIYHGRSIGGAVACQLALQHPPAAMILQSPFTSMKSMAAKFFLPGFLVSDPFDNKAVLKSLDRPVLICHGTDDTIIPIAHGKALADIAMNATFIEYENAGHNDFPIESARYWNDIKAFLADAGVLEKQ